MATLLYHVITKQNFSKKMKKKKLKRSEIPTKTPLVYVKKVVAKKGHAKKDVKSKWAAKASCC